MALCSSSVNTCYGPVHSVGHHRCFINFIITLIAFFICLKIFGPDDDNRQFVGWNSWKVMKLNIWLVLPTPVLPITKIILLHLLLFTWAVNTKVRFLWWVSFHVGFDGWCVCGGSQNIPKVVIVWSVKKDLINIGRFMVKPHNKLVRESGTRDVENMRW